MFPLAFVAESLQGHWWGFISRNYFLFQVLRFSYSQFPFKNASLCWACTKVNRGAIERKIDWNKYPFLLKFIFQISPFQSNLKEKKLPIYLPTFKTVIWVTANKLFYKNGSESTLFAQTCLSENLGSLRYYRGYTVYFIQLCQFGIIYSNLMSLTEIFCKASVQNFFLKDGPDSYFCILVRTLCQQAN